MNSVIEEIMAKIEPFDVVSEYITMKKSGRNFMAKCPFHSEKTPSFSFDPDRGLFHCFGCGKSGNLVQFIMEIEGITFLDAIKKLAGKAGVVLKRERMPERKQKLYDTLFWAKEFYHNILLSAQGEEIRDYLNKRGILISTIREFEIGYAPSDGDRLLNEARKKGIDPSILLDAGLLSSGEANVVRDFFRDRIIFPIYNSAGTCVGFGGRVLRDDVQPKYLNSPETKFFLKSNILYGFHKTKDEIQKLKSAILVEGYIDFLKLYQEGIRNCVAPLGTAFTEKHSQFLKRYADRVFILFDQDPAGSRAMERSLESLLKREFDVKIVQLEPGEDPDSFISKFGKAQLIERIRKAKDFVEVLTPISLNYNAPMEVKTVLDRILHFVSFIGDEILRESYLRKVANTFKFSVELLRTRIAQRPASSSPDKGEYSSEIILITHLLDDAKEQSENLLREFSPDDFDDPLVKKLVEKIKSGKSLDEILMEIEDAERASFISALMKTRKFKLGKLGDVMKKLQERKEKRKKRELINALSRYEKEGKKEEVEKILKELNYYGNLNI